MTSRKPDDYDSVEEAQEKVSEVMSVEAHAPVVEDDDKDVEELSEEDLKEELRKFLRGERRRDPRL